MTSNSFLQGLITVCSRFQSINHFAGSFAFFLCLSLSACACLLSSLLCMSICLLLCPSPRCRRRGEARQAEGVCGSSCTTAAASSIRPSHRFPECWASRSCTRRERPGCRGLGGRATAKRGLSAVGAPGGKRSELLQRYIDNETDGRAHLERRRGCH